MAVAYWLHPSNSASKANLRTPFAIVYLHSGANELHHSLIYHRAVQTDSEQCLSLPLDASNHSCPKRRGLSASAR